MSRLFLTDQQKMAFFNAEWFIGQRTPIILHVIEMKLLNFHI
jgi:hypothetical protein